MIVHLNSKGDDHKRLVSSSKVRAGDIPLNVREEVKSGIAKVQKPKREKATNKVKGRCPEGHRVRSMRAFGSFTCKMC